jgi:hypothetical protein
VPEDDDPDDKEEGGGVSMSLIAVGVKAEGTDWIGTAGASVVGVSVGVRVSCEIIVGAGAVVRVEVGAEVNGGWRAVGVIVGAAVGFCESRGAIGAHGQGSGAQLHSVAPTLYMDWVQGQPEKALTPMDKTASPITMDDRFAQRKKAYTSIDVTESGMTTDSRLVPRKARLPIDVTESPITTDDMFEQP